MPLSPYVASIRALIGSQLLVLPGVTAVIRNESGQYLLVRHSDGDRWGTIGGSVEPGEYPRDALRREILEEVGVGASVGAVLDSYGGLELMSKYSNGDHVAYVTTAYWCQLDGVPRVAEPDEVSEIGWFSTSEIASLDRFEWIDRVISDAEMVV